MTRQAKIQNQQTGFIMPVLLFTIVFIMIMLGFVTSFALNTNNLASTEAYKINAQMAADAGLDIGINELNIAPGWTGTGGPVDLLNTGDIRTSYEVTVIPGATDEQKIISVTAKTFAPASSTDAKATRRYELDLQAVTSGGTGPSSVVTGVGGLVLSNNAKITGGDVVVNGFINMGNNSQIGTQSNSVNVRVAHQLCPQPPDATYPQLCGAGNGQPITIGSNAKIYATVHANNQTNGAGMFNPGLITGQPVTPITLPQYDRSSHPVDTTKNATDPDINCPNNSTRSWPANVKIVGNITFGNNCRITINGNVWITGNVNTGNNGEFIIANSLGTTRPVMMVDGASGFVLGNNGKVTPNSSGTGMEVRTFWSHSSSGCSPNCVNLTGVGLANSQNVVTINLANNGNAANSIFMAEWSRAKVANNGALGAISGQSIELSNNAVINFTASVPGSDNRTQTWVKRGYMRVYD